MNRSHYHRRQRRLDEFAALLRYSETLSKQCLCRRRTKAHQRVRPHERDLGLQPGAARIDLSRIRLCVNPSFTARLPFEMLHDVCDIHRAAIDAGLLQRAIEQLPCRTDERMT